MKWMEIIELRSVECNREALEKYLKMLVDGRKNELQSSSIRVYTSPGIGIDYSIHLYHTSHKPEIGESSLALHLTSGLKEFGLINHSIWVELQEQ